MQQQYGQTGRDFDYLQDREQFYYPERKLNMAHNFLSGYGYGNTTSGKQYGNTLKDLAGPAMMAMAVSDRDAKRTLNTVPGKSIHSWGTSDPIPMNIKIPSMVRVHKSESWPRTWKNQLQEMISLNSHLMG